MSKSPDERIAELEEAVLAYGETLERHRVAWAAVWDTIEELGPPGILPSLEQVGPSPIDRANAIAKAFQKIAG